MNFHSLPLGMQNETATLEDGMQISYKTKHTCSIRSNNYARWYLSKGTEKRIYTKTCVQML